MNLMQRRARFLQDKLLEAGGDDIVYERPGQAALNIKALPGSSTNMQETETGLQIQFAHRDFTINVSDLKALVPPRPERNDRIIRANENGHREVFLVNSDGANSPYEETDEWNVAFRVHTVRDFNAAYDTNNLRSVRP